MSKIALILKILKARRFMLIVPRPDGTYEVETTFEPTEYTWSGRALYFNTGFKKSNEQVRL